MLKMIIANSPALIAFIAALELSLSAPQYRHVLNVVESLIVGEGVKTLSGLCRWFVSEPDPKAMADSFRESPWRAEPVRQGLKRFLVKTAFRLAQASGLEHLVYFSIDDSIAEKHKATEHLEGVDWQHDHSESTRKRPIYQKGLPFVLCRLHVGPFSFTIDLRLYLREDTVRRLNRQRPKERRLKFRTKYALARTMLAEVVPLIPEGYPVYVLFDSWYASAKLIKWCRRQHWHVICALRSNRSLNGEPVRTLAQRLQHQRYTRVTLTAADQRPHTYWVRQMDGRLNAVPYEVRVFISKRHRRDRTPRYYLSTDLSLSAQQALSRYTLRWPIEIANLYLKTRLGLADFRLRSFEAIEKYCVLAWLALAFLEWKVATSPQPSPLSLADIIRRQRHLHTRQTLRAACQMALDTGDVDAVLDRFAPVLA